MTREKPKPKPNETAYEEFARRVRELYELAGKMGLRLSVIVKAKGADPVHVTHERSAKRAGLPAEAASTAKAGAGGKLSNVMTERQRGFARHALGLPNRNHTSYRNHFCIGPAGDGYSDWQEMVSSGWAVERKGDLWGGNSMFHLTLEGALLARDPKEHLGRADTEMMRKLSMRPVTQHRREPGDN